MMTFKCNRAVLFLRREIILLLMIASMPAAAASQTQSQLPEDPPPLELKEGWQYRRGDSPLDEAGVPLWANEDTANDGWQPIDYERGVKDTPGLHEENLWLRVGLPGESWGGGLGLIPSWSQVIYPWGLLLFILSLGVVLERRFSEAHEQLQEYSKGLEIKVAERTLDLQDKNEILEETLVELKSTQTQLVQSGKMASLGMLSAGITHEINTPIGVIHSNADVESRAVDIIRNVMEDPAFAVQVGEHPRLNRAFKILEDTNAVTREATRRVTTIIQSLKSFARLDQAELEDVDLHEGIDGALTLLHHLLNERIEVVKNYETLPEVQCYAGQINQVFMSLLTNAVQAIEETGMITVTTRHDGVYAVVEVADTGCGIAPEHLERVFDPGYTTKGVGVGVGLGLSITYRVIEDHHGSIEIQSESGTGTTCTIRLPITPFEPVGFSDRK